MKLNATKSLVLYVVLVLVASALLSRIVPAKRNFDARPVERLRAREPQLVLIGDSMLDSRIDARVLEEKLDGKPVTILWNGGAASACWFLLLKNHVLTSGIHPTRIYIFFRDRMLTDAKFRTTGIFRPYLESLMRDDEPVCRLVLGSGAEEGGGGGWERWISAVYPVNARRTMQHRRISEMMFRAVTANGHAAKALERRVNAAFEVVKMRGELMAESTDVSEKSAAPFDPDPQRSFLPHIVALAENARIPLSFVRVKRHALASGEVPQTDALRAYVADLSAWVRARGCQFIDFTEDQQYTADMYLKAEDDHIGPWAKARSTEIFAARIEQEGWR